MLKAVLMHKNIPVMDIELDEDTGSIIKNGEIFNNAHLPVGVVANGGAIHGTVDRKELNHWWLGRSIPASRSGIEHVLETLNIPYASALIAKCYGLSLSDQYWISPDGAGLKWDDINFFGNDFSADIGNILFGNVSDSEEIDLISPDNTSDGQLKKKWIISRGKRFLVKGGSYPDYQEPINEVLASNICERLGIPHVSYELIWENGIPYSVCEDFINEHTELVSAYRIASSYKKNNQKSAFRHYLDCAAALGIPDMELSINQMLTLDYLIANADRHYNNFGAVRNADTLKWLGAAPLFDCGNSMWNQNFVSQIDSLSEKLPSKPFKKTHAEQIKLVSSFDWLDLSALDGISDEYDELLRKSEYINEARRNALVVALGSRIEQLEDIVEEQNPSLDLSL